MTNYVKCQWRCVGRQSFAYGEIFCSNAWGTIMLGLLWKGPLTEWLSEIYHLSSGGWKSKIKVLAGLVPSEAEREGFVLGLSSGLVSDSVPMSLYSVPLLCDCAHFPLLRRKAVRLMWEPTLSWNGLILTYYICNSPVSK